MPQTDDRPAVHLLDRPTYDAAAIKRQVQAAMEADGVEVRGKRVFCKPSFVYPARSPNASRDSEIPSA